MSIETASYKVISFKGDARDKNKDVFAVIENSDSIFFTAFDISTSSPVGVEMANRFNEIFEEQINSNAQLSRDEINKVLLITFELAKKEIRIGKASFLMIQYVKRDKSCYCFHVGDVRLGEILQDQSIKWITNVHTGANLFGKAFTDDMLESDQRHILIRCMNFQKSLILECTELKLDGNSLVIATDGFWAGLNKIEQKKMLSGEAVIPEDDASILLMSY